jgi:hypothetical protein
MCISVYLYAHKLQSLRFDRVSRPLLSNKHGVRESRTESFVMLLVLVLVLVPVQDFIPDIDAIKKIKILYVIAIACTQH